MSITDTPIEASSEGIPAGDTPAEPVEAANQEPSEELVTVKVNGVDEQVTLDELRSGYSRQSDYTKKTQELAERAKRLGAAEALVNALDNDPINTLKALNDAYEVNESDAKWDEMDPQEQRIARLEQQLRHQEARDARSVIEGEFKHLEATFGSLDRQEVASFALSNGLSVTDAYKVMNFDSLRTERERFAEEAKVVEAKRSGQLPHASGGAQKGAIAPANQGKKLDVRESYLAAVKQVAG